MSNSLVLRSYLKVNSLLAENDSGGFFHIYVWGACVIPQPVNMICAKEPCVWSMFVCENTVLFVCKGTVCICECMYVCLGG